MRRIAALALPLLAPWPAAAHVKWFEAYQVSQPPTPVAATLSLPYFWFGIGLVLLFFLVVAALERRGPGLAATRGLDALTGVLRGNADAFLLAVFGAFFVALFAIGGTWLTPELRTEQGWVPWVHLVIALLLVARPTRALAAILLVATWALTLLEYDFFHLLDYLALGLGIAGYLLLSALPDGAWHRRRFAVLRIGVAFGLMWSSMEKFAYPHWFAPLLEERPFLAFGIPFGPYTTMAGVAEFTLGFGLLWTPLVRRLSALALFALMFAAVYPFGRVDLVGHATILAALLVTVADPERGDALGVDAAWRWRVPLVPAALAALLAVTMGSYNGFHHLIYDRAGDRLAWLRAETAGGHAHGPAPGGLWRGQEHYHSPGPATPNDFVRRLLAAEEAAAELARDYLRAGDDPAVRRVAEAALAAHEARIAELRTLLPGASAAVR